MSSLFIVQYDHSFSSVSFNNIDNIFEKIKEGNEFETDNSWVTLIKEPRTRKRLPLGDFASLGMNTWFGVASERGIELINKFTINLRKWPAHLSKPISRTYCLFAIDDRSQTALDLRSSDITFDPPGFIRTVRRIAFVDDLSSNGFFRFSIPTMTSYLFCTEQVVNAYNGLGLTGLRFGEIYPNYRGPESLYHSLPE